MLIKDPMVRIHTEAARAALRAWRQMRNSGAGDDWELLSGMGIRDEIARCMRLARWTRNERQKAGVYFRDTVSFFERYGPKGLAQSMAWAYSRAARMNYQFWWNNFSEACSCTMATRNYVAVATVTVNDKDLLALPDLHRRIWREPFPGALNKYSFDTLEAIVHRQVYAMVAVEAELAFDFFTREG